MIYEKKRNYITYSKYENRIHWAGADCGIDSFWDPLWTYEIEYVDTYYKVLHECISLPDISFFLRLDEAQSIRRATMRDPDTVHTADAKDLKQKRRDFLEFAKNNIPNFYILRLL